mmetsp:Transcript_108203/g.187295  ORF Transcript_108203/g.187295 Transcript_108203/m.187295 type:complete len:199 (+) Transcript_108203:103-699(+)
MAAYTNVDRGMLLLGALIFMAASPREAAADSAVKILGELKGFRDGSLALCEGMQKNLKNSSKDDSSKVEKWCSDWLSILGLNKGLTGLAKDFVLNYLGRSSYHDKNGPLVGSIKKAATGYSENPEMIRDSLLDICKHGRKLFKEDGALYVMLDELKTTLENKMIGEAFTEVIQDNTEVKKAFEFLAGPAPVQEDSEEL